MSTEAGNLVVMVGLPRSGKSTKVAKVWRPAGYIVVGTDEIRLALHGQRYVESAEPFVWATTYLMVDYLLSMEYKVVVDGTHVTQARRKPWRGRNAYFDVIRTSQNTCVERARLMNDPYIVPIIEGMHKQWEAVTEEEQGGGEAWRAKDELRKKE